VVGELTELGWQLTNAMVHFGCTERMVLLKEPETLNVVVWHEQEEGAKMEVEKTRPGLTMFTDRLWMEEGAAGYAVVWKKGNPEWASKLK